MHVFENPYEAFSLRDWESIQSHYQKYRFDSAIRTLDDIMPAITRLLSSEGKEIGLISVLRQVLVAYHAWNSGDTLTAKKLCGAMDKKIQSRMPPIIDLLSPYWPDMTANPKSFENIASQDHANLVRFPILIAHYALDEIAKLNRIIQYTDDYRSAFVRAFGLHELLLQSRLCYRVGQTAAQPDRIEWSLHSDPKQLSGVELCNIKGLHYPTDLLDVSMDYESLIKLLTETQLMPYDIDPKRCFRGISVRTVMGAFTMKKFWNENDMHYSDTVMKNFRQARNNLTHYHYSVPKQLAEAALQITKANFNEFQDRWLDRMGFPDAKNQLKSAQCEVIPWNDLLALIGLNDLRLIDFTT